MIVLCNPMMWDRELVEGCAFDPALGGRILTYANCYGNNFLFCDIWVIEEAGRILGAVSQYNGSVTVSASPEANMEELAGLLAVTPGVEFEARSETMEALRPFLPENWYYEESAIMCWQGEAPALTPIPRGLALVEKPPLGRVHELLCGCFEGFSQAAPFMSWYVDVSCRMRRGISTIYTLEDKRGEALATAGIYYGGPAAGVIACVGTRPDSRGRGYGKVLLERCVAKLLEEGRTPYLNTAHDGLIPYYEGLGFVRAGSRTVARLR